jgi:hypothetical protein
MTLVPVHTTALQTVPDEPSHGSNATVPHFEVVVIVVSVLRQLLYREVK